MVTGLTLSTDTLLSRLAGYRLLPQLRRELIIDRAIATIDYSMEEIEQARQRFYEQHHIIAEAERQIWLKRYGMSVQQLEALVIREWQIEAFKHAMWEHRLETYFLSQKAQLDRVVYSLLRTATLGSAQELFFRIQANEQSFAELAREYSQGCEAESGGVVGPVPMTHPHPELAKLLSVSWPGQLWHPLRFGNWYVILRLEKRIPAQLDAATRQHLRDRLFETWLQQADDDCLDTPVSLLFQRDRGGLPATG